MDGNRSVICIMLPLAAQLVSSGFVMILTCLLTYNYSIMTIAVSSYICIYLFSPCTNLFMNDEVSFITTDT